MPATFITTGMVTSTTRWTLVSITGLSKTITTFIRSPFTIFLVKHLDQQQKIWCEGGQPSSRQEKSTSRTACAGAQSIDNKRMSRQNSRLLPNSVAMWFCDWFASNRAFKFEFIHQRASLLDAFFATTAGEKLSVFESGSCRTAFLQPSPCGLDRGKHSRAGACPRPHFCRHGPEGFERRETLEKISEICQAFSFGIYGSMGQPAVYGSKKDSLMSLTGGLNLSRLQSRCPEQLRPNRLLMGNGLLCCTRAETGSVVRTACLIHQ